ncbi:MAG: archaetidylserine decarboxylase [Gemmatimonadota bacterium]
MAARLADSPVPKALRWPLYRAFAAAVGADTGETERPLASYGTFDAFFTRRLRAGARRWPDDSSVAGSPVDGVVGRFGKVEDGAALQAKGRPYLVDELLGDADLAARFAGGVYLTIYLAPRHYHRVHAPLAGALRTVRHVAGRLLPVNAPAVALVDRLFVSNERVACAIEGDSTAVAVVAVGALNVGRISVPAAPGWNPRAGIDRAHRYDPTPRLERGDELMIFHLGSTVVLLFDGYRLAPGLRRGAEIRLGDPIAVKR